ncbi:MAG: DUF502 domain-containing protein [Phycisphaerales bacterium]|nr:DUF502 domain-containing protein [Phycisphaerales bacterium]
MPAQRRKGASNFRRFFLRGLTVLLPSILTLWILWSAFIFVFNRVAEPINVGLRAVVIRAVPAIVHPDIQPDWYRVTDEEVAAYRAVKGLTPTKSPDEAELRGEIRRAELEKVWRAHWYLQGAGLVVAISLIYLAGLVLGGFLGRKLYIRLERIISRVPGFKQVYPHVKQLVDLILGDKPMAFNKVVMVQFPRTGNWAIAFVTGRAMRDMSAAAGPGEYLTVFVPNTPTPFTGFTLTIPAAEVIEVPISIDEALRYVITGGVLVPGQQQTAAGEMLFSAVDRVEAVAAGGVAPGLGAHAAGPGGIGGRGGGAGGAGPGSGA